MTLQALFALLLGLPHASRPPQETLNHDQLPRWERHPFEQRYLRERDQNEASRRLWWPPS